MPPPLANAAVANLKKTFEDSALNTLPPANVHCPITRTYNEADLCQFPGCI